MQPGASNDAPSLRQFHPQPSIRRARPLLRPQQWFHPTVGPQLQSPQEGTRGSRQGCQSEKTFHKKSDLVFLKAVENENAQSVKKRKAGT